MTRCTSTPLHTDKRGSALIEFALVAPVMLLLILGLCDLCYQSYAQSILGGAVQRAARDAALENGSVATATLDGKVLAAVRDIAKGATWSSERKSYKTFADVRPEHFDDDNKNGRYDRGECYSDVNGNAQWDADPGANGQGGANDVTQYTMTIEYPRLFPITGLIGSKGNQKISATTILKNQPFGTQVPSDPATICT